MQPGEAVVTTKHDATRMSWVRMARAPAIVSGARGPK
jgi:hypothetical protein